MRKLIVVAVLVLLFGLTGCSDSDSDRDRRRLGGEFVRVEIIADGDHGPIEYSGTWESGEIFEELLGVTPETLTLEREGDFELRIFTPERGCVTFHLGNRPPSYRSCGLFAAVTQD